MAAPHRTFPVLGDKVEVVLSSEQTNHSSCCIVQTVVPGGGPPPHVHQHDDEVFLALDPGLEFFDGEKWLPLPLGQPSASVRGNVHTFRNAGKEPARILVFVAPGGFDDYLQQISGISMPADAAKLFEISDSFGISFPAVPSELIPPSS